MIKRFVFPLALVIASIFCEGQTKLIAHKSHSGTNFTFRIAYTGNFFEMGNSNLGRHPDETVKTAALDSLILVSDSVAVLVTSTYCKRRQRPDLTQTKWKEGRDTVYHHPLFSTKNSIDDIKNYLRNHYHFRNPVDSVKFSIKQDCGDVDPQYLAVPMLPNDDNNNNDLPIPYAWLFYILLFSLLVAGISNMYRRLRLIHTV